MEKYINYMRDVSGGRKFLIACKMASNGSSSTTFLACKMVAALLFGTSTKNIDNNINNNKTAIHELHIIFKKTDRHIPPNIHFECKIRPASFFRFVNKDSSISTIFPWPLCILFGSTCFNRLSFSRRCPTRACRTSPTCIRKRKRK